MLAQKLLSMSLWGTEWILYFLIVLSILSWAVIIERIFILRQKSADVKQIEDKVQPAFRCGDMDQALSVLQQDTSSLAIIGGQLLKYLMKNGPQVEEYLATLLSQEKLRLESRIAFLGTMVSIAPFVGLLGTVLGIINAFHGLSMNKQGGELVMAGIAESLVATALGLFIAIPAAAAYNYFVRTIKKIIVSSENFARILLAEYPSQPN